MTLLSVNMIIFVLMKEIERKFLVEISELEFIQSHKGIVIKQAYIQNEKESTVRIRIKGEKAYLTIKIGKETLSRDEFEYQIPLEDVQAIMELMNLKVLSKTRYELMFGNHLWEVDVFEGKLKGLILAEIELISENEFFDKPAWLGKEVTDDPRYLNAKLIELI